MEVIQSFQVDHTDLKPGIYVSRSEEDFVTFDIRMTAPNKEPAIAPAALHTIEHLLATWFRNKEHVKESVVYVGPMGCCTGFYIIMRPGYTVQDMRKLCIEAFSWIEEVTEVPGTTPDACGNYLLHDLPMAKWEARRYAIILHTDFHSEYKMLERPDFQGNKFHDA